MRRLEKIVLMAAASLFALTEGVAAADEEVPTEGDPTGAEVAPPDPPVAPEPPATPAPEPEKGQVTVKYDKGLTFKSGDVFDMKIALRSQFRFETIKVDESEFQSHFMISRLRLQFEGFAYDETLTYKVELGMSERGATFLKDFFVDKKLGSVHLRFGQWKRPFNRQELVSDFASEFNERALTAEYVGGGRDLGVAIHNNYEKSPEGLEWAFGVFNDLDGGDDRPRSSITCVTDPVTMETTCSGGNVSNVPADFDPAIVARVGWNSAKMKGYSEGDLEGGPLRFAVAANYKLGLNDLSEDAGSVTEGFQHVVGADAMIKVEGASVQLGVYMRKDQTDDATFGFFAQVGYFLTPKKLQVAARFAQVPADDVEESIHEIRGALNWMWEGHAWKLATDVGYLHDTTTDAPGQFELRAMGQLTF